MLVSAALVSAVLAFAPGFALADVNGPSLNAYARARLADEDGALGLAASSYRQALAIDPTNAVVALRSYRQAIESGDMALALSAARSLDTARSLPRDGTLLLIVDALGRKDWAAARGLSRRLETEGNFSFLAPIISSWVSLADGPYVAPVADPGRKFGTLTERYIDEHRALQLLAQGQADAAAPAIQDALAIRTSALTGLRMTLAARLVVLGQKEAALACLPDTPAFATARRDIAGGARIVAPPMTPVQGVARLLSRLGDDIVSGESRSLSLVLARLATFGDPGSAEFRINMARLLQMQGHADSALLEAGKVPAKGWYGLAAQDVRIDALMAAEKRDAALALAQQVVARPDAGAAEHMRLANILSDSERHDDAARAYRTARAYYTADGVPWTLYLLEGSALERGGKWDEARPLLEKAVALAPEEPVVLNYLGYAQVSRRENVPAALALLKKASALKPDDPSITDSLGWAYYISGNAGGAVPVLERAAIGAPDNMTINEHLGDALWTVGRRYEARYAWSTAGGLAEGPDAARIAGKMREGLRPEYAAP